MQVRKVTLDDLETIERISEDYCFEPNRDWKGLIDSDTSEMFILEDKKVLGFTGLIYYDWNNTVQISNIFIKPQHRGKGLGLKLIEHLKNHMKGKGYRCIIAEAPSDNTVLNLYKKAGFRRCGYNDRYYTNKGDKICIWMSYDIV